MRFFNFRPEVELTHDVEKLGAIVFACILYIYIHPCVLILFCEVYIGVMAGVFICSVIRNPYTHIHLYVHIYVYVYLQQNSICLRILKETYKFRW